jgi:hypothetical protein
MCACLASSLDALGAGLKGNAEGRFHLEKNNGRDCLMDPSGKPFLSLGVNHVQNIFPKSFSGDREKECDAVFKNLTSWGFNTAGYGSPAPLCRRMPYLAPMYLTKNANYESDAQFTYSDVFDPAVQEKMREIIRYEIGKQQGNANLIGYYWTDTPQWDLERSRKKRGTDWVSTLREMPADAPGKMRYEQFLKEGGTLDEDFLRLIARELYKVLGEETRRLAPDALIFGERYLVGDHPACVIEEALPYIDVLSIQPGGATFNAAYFDELHEKFKKPILLCDHQCSFPTPDYPKTMWQQMESEEAAGQAYAQYLEDAFSKPYIIGFQRCQYIDRFEKRRGILKQGVLKEDGTPYKTLAQYIREANTAALDRFVEERK